MDKHPGVYEWETIDRFAVRNYTYRYSAGIDEGIFECDRCGALVPYVSIPNHDNFHSLIATLLATSALS